MAETGVNWLAVLVAAAAGFAFGAAWYMTLGKAWMAALSRSAAEIRASGQGPLAFATAAAAQLVMAFFLAGLVGHLEAGAPTLAGALTTGFFVWLAFIATTMMVNHRFQGARWSLTAIDAGHWLGVLLVQGLAIGLFG